MHSSNKTKSFPLQIGMQKVCSIGDDNKEAYSTAVIIPQHTEVSGQLGTLQTYKIAIHDCSIKFFFQKLSTNQFYNRAGR